MLDIVPDNSVIQILIVVFLGLVLGSFSTAVVYRTRHNQSWIWNNQRDDQARSFCPSCGHTLGVRDLIPVFSWLFQKGQCRYCSKSIPTEYILLEMALILICFCIYGLLGLSGKALFLMVLAPFFVSQVLLALKYNVLSKLLVFILIVGGASVLF